MLAGTTTVKPLAPINAMTIDVEDYFHTLALSGAVSRADWHRLPSRVEMNTDRLLELFEQQEVKATFFILGWVAERFPNLVHRIAAGGHEIGCYGYHHESAHDQLPATFREETRRAKFLLEDLTGQHIEGYRAVNCSVTRSSLWVLDVLVELGFKWDASIYPIYHDQYGLPETPSEPYTIITRSGRSLSEFPFTTTHFMGLQVPVSGGGSFRQMPYPLFRYLFRAAGQSGNTPRVFYLHPWEIDPEQPHFSGLSLASRLRHYRHLKPCFKQFKRLLDDFHFTTLSQSLTGHRWATTYTNLDGSLVQLT